MPPPGAAARAMTAYEISLFRGYFRLCDKEFVPNGSQLGQRPVEW
jgi:hypothetical protein